MFYVYVVGQSEFRSKRFRLRLVLNFPCFLALIIQCAKKVVSDSPGLVNFAMRLVNSVFNLPARQVMFFEEVE